MNANFRQAKPRRTKLDLDEILSGRGSDKQSKHGYAPIYHAMFKHLRDQPLALLEIGIGTLMPGASSMYGHDLPGYRPGASLRAWRDYFPSAVVHGVDIQLDTMISGEERIVTALCDSTSAEAVKVYLERAPVFDIIIDDGVHTPELQLRTLRNLYPALKPNGIYVIEDVEPRGSWTREIEGNPEFKSIIGDALYFGVNCRVADLVVISKRAGDPLDV